MLPKPDKNNREESNTMMDSAAVDGTRDAETSEGDSADKAVFMSGLSQSLKNVHQYRIDMIEKIKNRTGNYYIHFRGKK